jgi:DNA-binding transcriptional MerR regulator
MFVMPDPPALLRIGALSRRVGLSDHVLRAWERRYGLLRPLRTEGGFRLYSEADVARVRRMQEHLAAGLSPAEAARAALSERVGDPGVDAPRWADGPEPAGAAAALTRALDDFDEPAAHAALDRLLGAVTVATVVRDVLLPYLRDLGDRWAAGTATVAQEHFASNVIRSRLLGLARGWGGGDGRRALLACFPGEQHDLPLLIFGVMLNRQGWRIDYLGADTPLAEVDRLAADTRPDLVVLVATMRERLRGLDADLARLAARVPLALGGAGVDAAAADAAGARLLAGDPVTAAEQVAASTHR